MKCIKCGTHLNSGYFTCPACTFNNPIPKFTFSEVFGTFIGVLFLIAVIYKGLGWAGFIIVPLGFAAFMFVLIKLLQYMQKKK